jgi:hypothetical protein
MFGAIPTLPQYALKAWCSVEKRRDNFIFYLDLLERKQKDKDTEN